MTKKGIIIVSVLILSTGISLATNTDVANAEDVTYAIITGSVVDSSTGEAIANATVEITGTEQSTITDEYGIFVFEQVETGTHTLSIEAYGYQTTKKSIEVTEQGVNVEIEVKPVM